MRQQAVWASVALFLALTGCSKQGASDDSLANDIKAKLYADPVAKQANVNVAVKNGAVTLTGDAPSSDVELAAVKAANSVNGVTHVDDQLKVDSAASQLPNAGGDTAANTTPAPAPVRSKAPASAGSPYSAPPPAATASAPPPPPVRTVPEHVDHTIASGERISVRTIDTISSKNADVGQTFRASLDAPISSDGVVVIPAGETVTLALSAARGAGRIKGSSELEVRLQSISYQGRVYQVDSSAVTEVGKGRGKQTAVRTGIGAAAGAVIGAIAGGGKGAAIGSLAGGGAGAGYQIFTHGQQVTIPSESVLVFTLQSPLTVR